MALALGLSFAVVACGGGDDPADTPDQDAQVDGGVVGDGEDVPAEEGSEAASVVELAALIEENGHTCALEYEGLRDGGKELSLCTIGGEQVTLSIWFDREALDAFRSAPPGGSGGITLIGANWTIDLSDPQLAETLAGELDAQVRED